MNDILTSESKTAEVGASGNVCAETNTKEMTKEMILESDECHEVGQESYPKTKEHTKEIMDELRSDEHGHDLDQEHVSVVGVPVGNEMPQNVSNQEPCGDPNFPCSSSSLILAASHVGGCDSKDRGGEEGDQVGQEAERAHEVGLGSGDWPRSSGPEGLRPSLSRQSHSSTDGERKQERCQRTRKVDHLCSLFSQAVLHTSHGKHSDVPQCRSTTGRCGGSAQGEGRRCLAGGVGHEEDWTSSSRRITSSPLGANPGAEEEAEQGHQEGRDRQGCPDHPRSLGQEADQAWQRDDGRGAGDQRRLRDVNSMEPSDRNLEPSLGAQVEPVSSDCLNVFHQSFQTPQDVVDLIQQSLVSAEYEVTEAFMSLPGFQLDLMEVCCGPESGITQAIRDKGGTAERIGLQNKMDLTTPAGVERASQFCEVMRPRYMWLSPICGPTSPLQNLNQRTPEQCHKLQKKRKYSKRMAKSCVRLAEEQLARGGEIGWEWPIGQMKVGITPKWLGCLKD